MSTPKEAGNLVVTPSNATTNESNYCVGECGSAVRSMLDVGTVLEVLAAILAENTDTPYLLSN